MRGGVFVAAKELKKARREGGEGKRKGHGGVYRIPVLDDGSAGPISSVSQDGIEKPVGLARDSLGAFYVSEKRIEIEGKIVTTQVGITLMPPIR